MSELAVSPYGRQTDGQTDGQDPQSGLSDGRILMIITTIVMYMCIPVCDVTRTLFRLCPDVIHTTRLVTLDYTDYS